MAEVDYFLKIDGIKGESQDSKHKDEIDISSYGWGMNQSGTSSMGGGGGAGKVAVHDMHFSKKLDVSSPKLMEACATGSHIKSALFTARKAGKDQQEFFTITLTDILISSVQHAQKPGASADSLIPTEDITINFAKYEVSYKQQQADGTLAGAVKHGFHLKENKVV